MFNKKLLIEFGNWNSTRSSETLTKKVMIKVRTITKTGSWKFNPKLKCLPTFLNEIAIKAIIQKLVSIPAIVNNEALLPSKSGCLTKFIIFNDNTGKTQGIKFKTKPPRIASNKIHKISALSGIILLQPSELEAISLV